MASLSSWPSPESLSRCFTLVRWLHANGISWSGTASELTAQLRQDSDATLWFSDSDELVAFLETNDDALRQLGMESSVRKIQGRPRLIELHITTDERKEENSGPVEVVSPLADLAKHFDEPAAPTEAEQETESFLRPEPVEQRPESVVPMKRVEPVRASSSEPVTRLYSLLGLPMEDSIEHESAEPAAGVKEPVYFGSLTNANEESFRSRYLPLLVVAVVTVLIAVGIGALVRHTSANSSSAPANSGATAETEPAVKLDPIEVNKANALLKQAATSKNASAQFDLGMRYKDGNGVERDNGAALAWLNLARANGSTRAQSEIRALSPQVSPADAQRARIAIGKAFVSGTNVPRSYVIAHNWFSVAELAGSSEASALRKQIEAKMSGQQLQRARSTGK